MEEKMNQNPHPLEGPGPGGSGSSIGLEYWVQWQVLVCALILILPSVVAVRIIIRELHRHPPLITSTSSCDMWLPCWTNIHPLWLLFFRAFAFASMSFILYRVVIVLGGPFAFYFYTQWTFALVTLYFALATVVSARGCWRYSMNSFLGDKGESNEFLKKGSKASGSKSTASSAKGTTKGTPKFQSRYTQQEATKWKADFLEHLLQAIYQLIGSIHSVNAIFLMLDSALNSQPFSWSGLAYFVLWSVSYVVFQWILHACGFTWWPYPFLELSTPSAPLWYLGLGLVHLPCYGIYVLLVKAKGSIFSRIFPYAFARSFISCGRTIDGTRKNSSEKKQI
ncbi:hypothetical protein RHMOL_Rhmol13G0003400 [Rhododendron molle]|uniref:Uncharacterized protein n=1 Tax=Rhododendron molle TaxID=49168 RepID=A0ACC0L2V0_RHOML|nr:hypothetical protein RHMOL_Rhmol13G0003400 [Rhododendron molle]